LAFAKSKRSGFPGYEDFQALARGGKFGPLYLFIGSEDFLIDGCVDQIVDQLVPKESRGFNLDVVYGSKADPKDVVAHASSFPMMGERRVVVVKEFEKLVATEKSKEIVGNYIQHPLETTCLVLVSPDPDLRRRPFAELKKAASIFSCNTLYDSEVPGWTTKRIQSKGKGASIDACRMLQAYVGNSLRALDNEIDKLVIFVGDRKEITTEDIALVVGASKDYTVFDLQNCIGKKNMKEALTVLSRMIESGESPQLIIVMLTRFFTTLLKISELHQRRVPESQFAAELRISPYFVKQYQEFHAAFSPAQIESAFRALLSADTTLKTTSTSDPRLIMELLVYTLVKGTLTEEPLEV
jgi:DNA polymerase-3 subunit delta